MGKPICANVPEVSEYHDSELVDLALQLYGRACHPQCSYQLHKRAMEAKEELLSRLKGKAIIQQAIFNQYEDEVILEVLCDFLKKIKRLNNLDISILG